MNQLPPNAGSIMGTPGAQEVEDLAPTMADLRNSTIKEKLYNALITGAFSDIRFVVGQAQKKEIPAHRFILFINSPVFEKLLEASHKNINVTIADVEPAAFFAFLKFLYTDEFDVHVKDATAVLYLSKKYEVPRLALLSAEYIKSNISTKNVVSVLLSSEALGESSITYQARYFLRKNIRYVIHEEDFLHLNEEELCQIFASDELSVSEMELFNAAVHWAIEECKRQKLESTPQNYRFVLKSVLPLIRFPLMDRKEFTLHVCTKNILTDTECLNVMMHWDVSPKEWSSIPAPIFSNKPRTGFEAIPEGIATYVPPAQQEQFFTAPSQREVERAIYYDVSQGMRSPRGYRVVQASQMSKPPPPPRRQHIHTTHVQVPSSRSSKRHPQPFSYFPDPYTGAVSFPQNYA